MAPPLAIRPGQHRAACASPHRRAPPMLAGQAPERDRSASESNERTPLAAGLPAGRVDVTAQRHCAERLAISERHSSSGGKSRQDDGRIRAPRGAERRRLKSCGQLRLGRRQACTRRVIVVFVVRHKQGATELRHRAKQASGRARWQAGGGTRSWPVALGLAFLRLASRTVRAAPVRLC